MIFFCQTLLQYGETLTVLHPGDWNKTDLLSNKFCPYMSGASIYVMTSSEPVEISIMLRLSWDFTVALKIAPIESLYGPLLISADVLKSI